MFLRESISLVVTEVPAKPSRIGLRREKVCRFCKAKRDRPRVRGGVIICAVLTSLAAFRPRTGTLLPTLMYAIDWWRNVLFVIVFSVAS